MRIAVFFKGKRISLNVYKTGFLSRGLGLTFRTKNTRNLLFDFSKPVTWQGNLTSIFVFFPFLTLWVDKNNKVIDLRVIRSFIFSISQKKEFYRIVEIPFNLSNRRIIERFIGKNEFLKHYRG